MKNSLVRAIAVIACAITLGRSASAQTIVYDNSKTYSGSYELSNTEFGDQVFTSGVNVNNQLTGISFEYYGSFFSTSGRTGQLTIYANDGPLGAPNTALYQSASFNLANGYNTINITGITSTIIPAAAGGSGGSGVSNPGSVTWAVKFSGLTPGEGAGLLIFEKPTVGTSNNDYWQRDSGGAWALKQISGGSPIANFGARITAIPEPSVIQLTAVAGAFLAGMAGFRRMSK